MKTWFRFDSICYFITFAERYRLTKFIKSWQNYRKNSLSDQNCSLNSLFLSRNRQTAKPISICKVLCQTDNQVSHLCNPLHKVNLFQIHSRVLLSGLKALEKVACLCCLPRQKYICVVDIFKKYIYFFLTFVYRDFMHNYIYYSCLNVNKMLELI